MKVKSVGIVGTGVIGSSWAAFYASKGFKVKMSGIDLSLCQKGLHIARDFLEALRVQGLLPENACKKAISVRPSKVCNSFRNLL
jgi:3-hydroxyacyl-CoA dehydrogenase